MLNIQNPNICVQTAVTAKSKKSLAKHGTPLKEDFKPSSFDVICSRGKAIKAHPGTIHFLNIIGDQLQKYADASSKLEKSLIVSAIINAVRDASPQGGFVKEEGGRWYEVGDFAAREKVGQHLRNGLSSHYSSSSASKKKRRRADEASLITKLDDMVVRRDGKSLADRIEQLTEAAANSHSGNYMSDDELQRIFNQANMELLQRVKDQNMFNEEHDETKNIGKREQPSGSDNDDSSGSGDSKRKLDEYFDISDLSVDDFENFDLLEIDENDTAFDPIPINYCSV